MNTKYWGVFDTRKKQLQSTKSGAPLILPTRKYAREYTNIMNKRVGEKTNKVVRVAFNLEHRLHDSTWQPLAA